MTGFVEQSAARSASTSPIAIREGLDQWERVRARALNLLGAEAFDTAWVARLTQLTTEIGQAAEHSPDVGLYFLLNEKINDPEHYSALHAICCALIAHLAARWLEWPEAEVNCAVQVALSMNISMTRLQDLLAQQMVPISATQKTLVSSHAQRSVELLQGAGVVDPVWLDAVGQHHTVNAAQEGEAVAPAVRIAELIRRVDVYAAKLSRRRTRSAVTPAMAARDACLGPGGNPDALGTTLLRVLGLYPPGTYVELASGEFGVVVRRGERAHTPVVACLKRADGVPLMAPRRRDTAVRANAVKRGVDASVLRVRLNHADVLKAA
jgi:hypothetical protein